MKTAAASLSALACLALAEAAAGPPPSTYPTTVTRSWSRTSSQIPRTALATDAIPTTTVKTVTVLEPWPSSPNPELFPYTLTQTAITDRREEMVDGDTRRVLVSTTQAVTSTWVVWDTAPTDLPRGMELPKCEVCAPPRIKQDKRCTERGLETACHSQCKIRQVEGFDVWWCHQRTTNDTSEVAIGRVCSGGGNYYEQLLEPCDHADHRHDCPPFAAEQWEAKY